MPSKQRRQSTLLVKAQYEARAEIIQTRESPHRMPHRRSNMKTSFVVQGGYKSMLRTSQDRVPLLIKRDRSRLEAHHALHFQPIEMKTIKLNKLALRSTCTGEVSHRWGLSRQEKEPEIVKPISKMSHLTLNRIVTKRAIDSCSRSNKNSSNKNSKSKEVDRRESTGTGARFTTSSRTSTARRSNLMRSCKIWRTSFAL